MATLANIDNPVWGMGTLGYGVIVEGIAAIRQRMDLAIRTTKGTDPMRPQFGSRVYKFIDAPLNIAIPNIKRELLEALGMWVPDIKVISIRHYLESPANPVFEIFYRVLDETVIEKLLFDLRGGVTVTDILNEVLLQAYIPPNPNGYRYQVTFLRNGVNVFPLPDPSGFATVIDLFTWVQANYSYIGQWNLLTDRIICRMNSTGVTSASLEISVLPITRFSADFPELLPGEVYRVNFQISAVDALPACPVMFNNAGSVLSWVQLNWSGYADWFIEYLLPDGSGIFSDEFSDEFEVPVTGYRLVGVSHVAGFEGLLSIDKV